MWRNKIRRGGVTMIDALYEEMIMLCEIRGELDSESNAVVERKIASLQKQINELESVV